MCKFTSRKWIIKNINYYSYIKYLQEQCNVNDIIDIIAYLKDAFPELTNDEEYIFNLITCYLFDYKAINRILKKKKYSNK